MRNLPLKNTPKKKNVGMCGAKLALSLAEDHPAALANQRQLFSTGLVARGGDLGACAGQSGKPHPAGAGLTVVWREAASVIYFLPLQGFNFSDFFFQ